MNDLFHAAFLLAFGFAVGCVVARRPRRRPEPVDRIVPLCTGRDVRGPVETAVREWNANRFEITFNAHGGHQTAEVIGVGLMIAGANKLRNIGYAPEEVDAAGIEITRRLTP